MMSGHRHSTPIWPIVAESALFVLFATLLVHLYLIPSAVHLEQVRWWSWIAVGTPFFLGLMVEWRRKKRQWVTRGGLIHAARIDPASRPSRDRGAIP